MAAGTEDCAVNISGMSDERKLLFPGALLLLAKPGIVLAEVMAGFAGMLLAAPELPAVAASGPVLLAIAMAASGAAMLNGVLETASDRLMPRLAKRCRALETVGRRRALVISLALMVSGLILAALTAPPLTLILLACGCLSYLWLYTSRLKRRSPWGVLAGCIPGALPPLIGAAAVSGSFGTPPLLLAAFIFIWQLPHFWLLALECSDQYALAGIPVLPLTHGENLTKALTAGSALLLLPITIALGIVSSLFPGCLAVAIAAAVIFPAFCANCLYRSRAYRSGFRASLVYLLIIIGAISADSFLARIVFPLW